jgi:CRISPR-associated protein Cas2
MTFALSAPGRLHAVAYDIRDRRRWRRVFKLMKKKGAHRQLSVFLVRATPAQVAALARELENLIDPEQDSVVILPVDELAASRFIELGPKGEMPGARVLIV